jgi:hypothetical protein
MTHRNEALRLAEVIQGQMSRKPNRCPDNGCISCWGSCQNKPAVVEQRQLNLLAKGADAGKALGDGVLRDSAMRVPDGSLGVAPAHGPIE